MKSNPAWTAELSPGLRPIRR